MVKFFFFSYYQSETISFFLFLFYHIDAIAINLINLKCFTVLAHVLRTHASHTNVVVQSLNLISVIGYEVSQAEKVVGSGLFTHVFDVVVSQSSIDVRRAAARLLFLLSRAPNNNAALINTRNNSQTLMTWLVSLVKGDNDTARHPALLVLFELANQSENVNFCLR